MNSALFSNGGLSVRTATQADAELVYQLRYKGNGDRYFRATEKPDLQSHIAWFGQALLDHRRHLLIIEGQSGPVAHVRLDIDSDDETRAEIGIVVDPGCYGRGIGGQSIALGLAYARSSGIRMVDAEVHAANEASERLFLGQGFDRVGERDQFLMFCKKLPTDTNLR